MEAPPGRLPSPAGTRLTELLAALSLVSDLARGRPADEAMRACLVATAIAGELGLPEPMVSAVYFTTLLRSVGCTATSHEYAALFAGDDLRARDLGDRIDSGNAREGLGYLWATTRPAGGPGHVRAFARAARAVRPVVQEAIQADCEVGAQMARRLTLGPPIEHALLQTFERWDGKGAPGGLQGDQIGWPARVSAVAYAAITFEDAGRRSDALEMVSRWSGRLLDPAIAEIVLRDGGEVLDVARPADPWRAVVDAEPGRLRVVGDPELDQIANAFADVVDLKAPFLHGHSRGVAERAEQAGGLLGLGPAGLTELMRAGLLHDLGRVGIPSGTWEKPGPLSTAEWEAVRLHPYHTERILGRAPALRPLARLASFHHERLDGSGYHRGAPAAIQDLPIRILAAADAYQALQEPRPYRPAVARSEAARLLEQMSLDQDAVHALIEASGETHRRPAVSPSGMSPRELEVIGLLVRGRSEKEIAAELVIGASTVHTHVVHIYEKAGVRTRAGLAMYAMERDLIRPASREID